MSDDENSTDRPVFLNTIEAADHLGLKPNTLAKMRVFGTGPKYRKHGFKVFYALEDLNQWSNRSRRSSTSDDPDV